MQIEILSIKDGTAEAIAAVLMQTMQTCMKNVIYVIEQHSRYATDADGM